MLAAIAALGTSRVGTGRQYSPWLPPVLAVALRWMDPVDTFALGVALLPALSPPGTGVPESVLLSTKLESWRMLFVFSRLADKKLSTEKKQLLTPLFRVTGKHVLFGKGPLGPGHPYEAFVAGWIWLLPEPTLTWALDCLFVEGEKLLYRLGLGIMKECARKLAGGVHGEPGGGLETLLPRLTDATKMMATAYSFKFGQAKMARQRRKGTPVARHAMGHTGRNIGVLEEAGPVSDSMGVRGRRHLPPFFCCHRFDSLSMRPSKSRPRWAPTPLPVVVFKPQAYRCLRSTTPCPPFGVQVAREVSKFAASDSLIIPAIPKAGISALCTVDVCLRALGVPWHAALSIPCDTALARTRFLFSFFFRFFWGGLAGAYMGRVDLVIVLVACVQCPGLFATAPGRQLPVRHQGCEAYRMFSNAQDGSRLETLYSCCADFGPLLLLFKAVNGAIFGVFHLGLECGPRTGTCDPVLSGPAFSLQH